MADDDFDLARSMQIAQNTRGKGFLSQVQEIAALSLSRRRITAQEYYRYRLFDDQRYDRDAKFRFLGERCHLPLVRNTCDLRWWAVTDDKVVSQTMLAAFGAPLPRNQALIHPFRILPEAPTLKSADEVTAFLRDGAIYPVFAKPVSGVRSGGTFLALRHDPEDDSVVFHDESRRSVESFAATLWSLEGQSQGDGVLLQDQLVPHPDVARLTGPGISGVRVLVTIEADGPRVIGATWKIIGGDAIADNAWRDGNLVGALDLETGEVTRVLRMRGVDVDEMTHHPATGEALVGARLPHWDEVVGLCRRYAPMAHKVRFQGWDIAICESGPVIIEVNTGSSFQLTQLAHGEGIWTDEFERFVAWAQSVNETPPRGMLALVSRL